MPATLLNGLTDGKVVSVWMGCLDGGPMKQSKTKLFCVAAGLGLAATAGANVLWDGSLDYVASGNLAFAGSFVSGVTSHSGAAAYNLDSSLLVNASYAGPAIYGGVYGFSESDTATNGGVVAVLRSNGIGTPDLLRLQSPIGTGTVAQTLNGALLFATPAPANLTELSSLGATLAMALGNASGNYAVHWMVVGNAGTTYVSQATTGVLTQEFADYSLLTASTAWSVAVPDAQMNLGALDFSLAAGAIGNVTHAGVYLAAGTTNHTFDLSSFSAVPEPSVYAALFGLLALAFVWARRRRA
jgi:hypothetical protein